MPKKSPAEQPAPMPYRLPVSYCMVLWVGWIFLSLYLYGIDRIQTDLAHTASIPFSVIFGDIHFSYLAHASLDFVGLAVFFAVASLGGRRFLKLFKLQGLSVPEELLFGLGLGLGAFSQIALFMGLAGLFSPVAIRGVFSLIGAAVFLIERQRPFWKDIPTAPPVPPRGRVELTDSLAATLIAGLVVLNLLGALGPEIFYDSLVYHLALPQLYLIKHRIFPTPWNFDSGIPFNTEMLYGIGLAFGGDELAKLIPWGLSLTILSGISLWAKRFADSRVGLFATLLFYSCSMVSCETWFGVVELNWCFFSFIAVLALVIISENPEIINWRWLALIGLFTGFAMGTKYNAFPLMGVLLVVFLWERIWHQNKTLTETAPQAALLIAVPILTVSPWLLKNIFFYHNPIFPFFQESFTHTLNGPNWRGVMQDAGARNIENALTSLSGFWDVLSSVWCRTWDNSPFNSIGITFLLFLPWLFIAKWSKPAHRCLYLIFMVGWGISSLSSQTPRFLIPVLPFLAILLAISIFSDKRNMIFQRLLSLAVVVICATGACKTLNDWVLLGSWKVILGYESKSDYLQHSNGIYPTPYYAAAEFVNNKLPPTAKILFFQESRGFYFDRDFIAASQFVQDPLIAEVNQVSSPEEIRNYLKALGITHIFVNHGEISRRGSTSSIPDVLKPRLDAFTYKYLRPIFKKVAVSPSVPDDAQQSVEIYEIK